MRLRFKESLNNELSSKEKRRLRRVGEDNLSRPDGYQYTCNNCNKSFQNINKLFKHLTTHNTYQWNWSKTIMITPLVKSTICSDGSITVIELSSPGHNNS